MTSPASDNDDADLDLSASWQAAPATDNDLQLVGLSVRQAARALGTLASSDDVRHPTTDTRAGLWAGSLANWTTTEGSTHVENAFGGVRTMCLSAVNHMEVLVDSVQRRRATVAAWTLTRTVLESLGRVNYLLGADDVVEFLSRHVALIRGEMNHAKHSVLIIRDVGRLNVDEYVSNLRRMIREIGGGDLHAPSYTELVTNVLNEAAPDSESRRRYSQLSGVAHGELTALQMFLTDEGLVLPRALLVEAAHMVCAASILVGDKLRDSTTASGSKVAVRWSASRERALSAAFALLPDGEAEARPNATDTQS